MSCNKHDGEMAHYYHTLAEFADLVKMYGVEKVVEDMQLYQECACNLLRGYFYEE